MTLARPKNSRGPPGQPSDGEEKGSTSHARPLHDSDLGEFPVDIGQVIDGKYRVERLIGAGGMGLVMAAHDVALDRPVAIKFLHGLNSTTLEANSRFKREARAMAKLHSEHVVRVLDVGTLPSGEPYMVMEHLDGVDLAQLVKQRGYLGATEAVDYMLAACEAVAEAHVRGIIHRDLKPSNLYLARRLDGTSVLKLLDFGIAKIASDATEESQSFTTTTALLGSPVYMSPEQLQCSRDADARADIWSLGAIIYRLVAGPPFVASTMPQICTMILTVNPQPLIELVAGVAPQLDAAVLRCLEKDPDVRFPNVAELARALAPYGSGRAHSSVERAIAIVYSKGGAPVDTSSGEIYPSRASSTGPYATASALDRLPSASGAIPIIVGSSPSLHGSTSLAGVARPSWMAVRLVQLRLMSSRTLLLGSLALSVVLGFLIGLIFWIAGRSSNPADEDSFGATSEQTAAPGHTPPSARVSDPTQPQPPPPPTATPPNPPPVTNQPQVAVPVYALPTVQPAPPKPPQQTRRYNQPPRPPRGDNPTPPAPPSPANPPADNSDFGGRK
jgi:serine/threonine protein kinase